MADYDIFNGDADGICALLQLRLAEPRDSKLITGVKRDIDLLKQVSAKAGDRVTVLDVSMDKNHSALITTLETGANVVYFDHHFPGEIPSSNNLEYHIDTDAEVCTGLLVNKYLNGATCTGQSLQPTATICTKPQQLQQFHLSFQKTSFHNWKNWAHYSTITVMVQPLMICSLHPMIYSKNYCHTKIRSILLQAMKHSKR